MEPDLLVVVAIGGGAAAASLAGGGVALLHRPSTLLMSIALGFASGVLLATIAFEMLPQAVELGSLPIAIGGFVGGFGAIYALDLFVYRGRLAGAKSEQRAGVERFHRMRRPRGGEVTVLAAGTSAEELIEGLSIGVGVAIAPGLGLLVALAVAVDNFGEGLSIGELIRDEESDRTPSRRTVRWTGLIGAVVFLATVTGWLLLRGLAEPALGLLFAVAAGGMFYLTVTDLVPAAEEHHYQQSAAIAMAVGFVAMFTLSARV